MSFIFSGLLKGRAGFKTDLTLLLDKKIENSGGGSYPEIVLCLAIYLLGI